MFEEIAVILNIDNANTSTPGWFQLRTKASKNILDSMTEDETKAIEEEADRMHKEGLPQDVQRRCVPGVGRYWPICGRWFNMLADQWPVV